MVRITNIILVNSAFRVFINIDGIEETCLFPDSATADNIKNWAQDRSDFYAQLAQKEVELKDELIGFEA